MTILSDGLFTFDESRQDRPFPKQSPNESIPPLLRLAPATCKAR